ncbi:MAG: cold shock domain-containing protein [Chloroflexota bacterium]|nr:cold shock domain-containing protein [Chloroflexota bacterium]
MPHLKVHDETLFCERCGISFLWSAEEQKQAAAEAHAPDQPKPKGLLYCPGCRHLLPAADRQRGVVKWYSAQKRYGFITRRNAPELYVHGSALRSLRRLEPGDLVEFGLGTNERGPVAQAVDLLERGDGS